MSERGSAKTSMRQLAQECGLNVAAIYHYFESKDALLAAVVDERQYGTRIREVPTIDPSLPADERLRLIFGEVWRGALEEEAVWRLLLGEGIRGEPAVLPVGRNLLDVIVPGLTEWLAVSIPEIEVPAAAAETVASTLFFGFVRHIFEPTLPVDEIEKRSADNLAGAIFGSAR